MRKGFTLIELLVVIFIFAILGTIVYSAGYGLFSRTTFTGKVTACTEMDAKNGGMFNRSSGAPFSFAVDMDVAGEDGIVTFSSEDRKFANVRKGDSVMVRVEKYAPWNFNKAGEFHNGRLLKKFKVN
jgi:prepilin-type N-terminal cleavage/methylation domain-containing protein